MLGRGVCNKQIDVPWNAGMDQAGFRHRGCNLHLLLSLWVKVFGKVRGKNIVALFPEHGVQCLYVTKQYKLVLVKGW